MNVLTMLRSSVLTAGAIGMIVFLALWELLVTALDVQAFILLAPSEIMRELADSPRWWFGHTLTTARHALVGIGLSLLVAAALGMALSTSRFAERAAQPVLVLIMVAPWVAYINSVVIWLGGGDRPVLFLVSLVTMPAFTFAIVTGLRSADPALRDVLVSAGASRAEVLWRLRLPTALSYVTTAARFNLGLAIAAAYFSEGGALINDGLGAAGRRAQAHNDGQMLWASVMCTALLGIAALMVITIIERTLLHWHATQRQRPASPPGR